MIAGCAVVLVVLVGTAVAVALDGGSSTRPARSTRATAARPLAPTRLTRLPHANVLDGTAPLVVRLSGVVAANTPAPTISPAVAGRWSTSGERQTFTPASTLQPCTAYRMTIWGQTHAVGMAPLGRRRTLKLAVACPEVRGVQEALARLRYLPYRFHALTGAPAGSGARAAAARAAFKPPVGYFARAVAGAPPLHPGQLDATTSGALMVFQTDRGLPATGVADAATWGALLGAEASGHADRRPYTFVTVSQALPQTLEVHRGNRVVLTSPTNTGVPGATTADGTFPIFERLTSTTMSGTNPDGSHYSDPGVPWVNYFNGGDAVHGFDRASYGSPQSDGCVELPPSTAATVYGMLSVGDIVEVSG